MIIQQQRWHDKIRYILIDEYASVHLDLYDTTQNFGDTAFIWALWTNPDCRRQGHAKRLLEQAEHLAEGHGHPAVFLEWFECHTPDEILLWYCRSGYESKEFSEKGDYVLLKKTL